MKSFLALYRPVLLLFESPLYLAFAVPAAVVGWANLFLMCSADCL